MEAGDSNLSRMQESGGPNGAMEKQHPLKLTMIFQNIFEHLHSDDESLKVCRQVCSTWASSINIPILIDNNIEEFNDLMSKPEAILVCRNVTLTQNVEVGECSPTIFFETSGPEIRKLKILSTVKVFDILKLPKYCPNLSELDLQSTRISDVKIPKSLEQAWENPFPNLRAFTLRCYRYIEEPGTKYFIKTKDFIILFLSKVQSLNKFALMDCNLAFWQTVTNELINRPEICQRISQLHLEFFELRPPGLSCLWMTPNLDLAVLEIQHIPHEMTTDRFSTLLQNLAPTLKELNMKEDKYATGWPRNFQINFPCEMNSMKSLGIHSLYRGRTLVCSASKDGNPCNPLRMLPKLEKFSERFIERNMKFLKISSERFWETLFPLNSFDSEFVHNELKQIMVSQLVDQTYCEPNTIVEEIARCFPFLRKMVLAVNGRSMREVVTKMKSLPIEDFRATYHGTEDTLNVFTSAISGISFESCEQYANIINKEEIPKINTSLAEWEDLRHFAVCYAGPRQNSNKMPLDDVCIEQGFAKIKKLQTLKIRNFEIHSRHIKTIFDEIPLRTLQLKRTTVMFSGSEDEDDPTNIEGIRIKYPHCKVKDLDDYEEDDEEDEEEYE